MSYSPITELQARIEGLEKRVAALEGDDQVTYQLTPKGMFVTDLLEKGMPYQQACELADKHFRGGGS